MKWRWQDSAICVALFSVTVGALSWAQRTTGIPRDEGIYFVAAKKYWGWFPKILDGSAFSPEVIAQHWNFNTEHPALFKICFAFSWRVLHGLDITSETAAFRFSTWILAALAVVVIYLFGREIQDRVTGVAAALIFLSIPRIFFHAQLACFDMPVTAFIVFTTFAYYKSLTNMRWGIVVGVLFGLSIAGKHNALFLPIMFGLHYATLTAIDLWKRRQWREIRVPLGFITMGIFGPILFLGTWPWMWFKIEKHLGFYLEFHLNYSYYNVEYLGSNFNAPPLPFSYPFVMMLFTVPVVLLVLASIGAVVFREREPAETDRDATWLAPRVNKKLGVRLLFVILAVFPLILIAMPRTPISGGTKHFMTAYPFWALFAGVAVSAGVQFLKRDSAKMLAGIAVSLLISVPGFLNTQFTHENPLGQYNALAGGAPGGADIGLQRQFWGNTGRETLPWLNEHAPKNARVYVHDIIGHAWGQYKREELLRTDLRDAGWRKRGIKSSTVAIILYELHFNFLEYEVWSEYGTHVPTSVHTSQGVPIATTYARPQK